MFKRQLCPSEPNYFPGHAGHEPKRFLLTGDFSSITHYQANNIMKIAQAGVEAILSALLLAGTVHAQNVGIGFSNPQSKLTVNGNLAVGAGYNTTAPTNGALIEGNTGIGITAPQVPLHVDGEVFVSPGGVTGSFWNGTANIGGFQIDPSGYLGAQRDAGAGVHVAKTTAYTNVNLEIFSISGSAIGSIAVNSAGTGVVYNAVSDIRLKENIRPTAKGINDLMRIQVSDFNFKSKPGRIETGFIAQQLYTVLPDAVTVGGANPTAEPWTVDYGRVTPLLTKAIQEQQGEIDGLKAQNKNQDAAFKTELEKENAELQARTTEQDRKITALDAANASLKTEMAQLRAANEDLRATAARVAALEKMMANIQKKENSRARTVALEQ
jgi:hypothetical protein